MIPPLRIALAVSRDGEQFGVVVDPHLVLSPFIVRKDDTILAKNP